MVRSRRSLTPISYSEGLLFASVEHRTDNKEPSGDTPLTHPKYQTSSEETTKVLACRMRTQGYCPNKDVDAARGIDQSWRVIIDRNNCVPHPFSDWETLESQVLGIFEDEIAKIEDRP